MGIEVTPGIDSPNLDEEVKKAAGIHVNADNELSEALYMLEGFDIMRDDRNWGIDVYCEAVMYFISRYP
jgi:hypothetical protein